MLRVAFTATLVLLALPAAAEACTCVGPRDPKAAASNASVVFAGRVASSRIVKGRFGPDRVITFAVERVWKGERQPQLTVSTAADEGMCGYPFEEGRTYLVFAARDERGRLGTSLCSGSSLLSRAIRDAAALGTGEPVGDDPGAPPAAPPRRARP